MSKRSSLLHISALSLFRYKIFDSQNKNLGQLLMPNKLAISRNSPLRGLGFKSWEDFVQIELQNKRWHLEYEILPDHGIRYFLLNHAQLQDEDFLAVASCVGHEPWKILWQDQKIELSRKHPLRFGFLITQQDHVIGELCETTSLFALRRQFEVRLPLDWPLELHVFLFYLGVIKVYR